MWLAMNLLIISQSLPLEVQWQRHTVPSLSDHSQPSPSMLLSVAQSVMVAYSLEAIRFPPALVDWSFSAPSLTAGFTFLPLQTRHGPLSSAHEALHSPDWTNL